MPAEAPRTLKNIAAKSEHTSKESGRSKSVVLTKEMDMVKQKLGQNLIREMRRLTVQ